MYTVEALCQDAAQKRGGVKGANDGPSTAEYMQIWDAFVRYLKSCLEQKRGLHLHSFCKVGWLIERRRAGGQPDYRPHFALTEQFCRGCAMAGEAVRRQTKVPAGELCQFEDFNFSKASIKFSNQITKDQVFSGLRALVQRLGEVIAENKEVQVAFGDVGRLTCKGDREPQFIFSPEVYTQAGLERPATAASSMAVEEYSTARPSAAFRKDAPAEAQGMGVRGRADGGRTYAEGEYGGMPMQSSLMAPIEEEPEYPDYRPYSGAGGQGQGLAQRGALASSGSAPLLTPTGSAVGSIANSQYKKEVAYKEAMDRHITSMEARATEAIAERQAWQEHMSACLQQEREEIHAKRSRAQTNLHFLQHQIRMGEEKKREQRKEDIEAASAHDFPKFQEAQASQTKEFVHDQQARLRADLDEQVRTNNTLRNLAKQRERALEVNQLQANREEMALLRNAERAKKVYDREALATAWNSEIRMKNIWKAIDNHNKVGSQTSSHPPQILVTDGMQPPPSRGLSSAGRLMTGSSRRLPLGASSSLSRLEGTLGR